MPRTRRNGRNVRTTAENKTGRNKSFSKPGRKSSISRTQFVREIKAGKHPNYHVRMINGKATPASNPDKLKSNNLN